MSAPGRAPPAARPGAAPGYQRLPGQGVVTKGSAAGRASIVVYTTAGQDESGIRTLVGEYAEAGTNHGRRFFKKLQKIPGHESMEVYLYFWDDRDGADFSGWWFGNKVGGSQVWSRNVNRGLQPPKIGWTIPWDGDVREELVVASAAEKQAADRQGAQARLDSRKAEESQKRGAAVAAEWEARVVKATEKAADAELDVTEALQGVQEAMEGEDPEALSMAQNTLEAQGRALAETQRTIALEALAAQKATGVPPEKKQELQQLKQRVTGLQAKIKEGLQSLKSSEQQKKQDAEDEQKRLEEEMREKELHDEHMQQLDEMRPGAIDKVTAMEDLLEKVDIAAAPLNIEISEDMRDMMLQHIRETEQAVRLANQSIGEARRHISSKIAVVSTFVGSVKTQAVEEFTELQTKINEAVEKLAPFKTVRQTYEQKVQAKRLVDELEGKLSAAEIEVEKAAMMSASLGVDSDSIRETEAALSAAQSPLAQTTRLIDSKLRSAENKEGPVKDELKLLQERCKQSQEKLDEIRKTVTEKKVQEKADSLLKEVSEKVTAAEEELQRMAEAELPFLRSEQRGQNMSELITEADAVAAKVYAALAEAQAFIARKLAEVARFSEGAGRTVKEEVDMLQKRLEEGRERLQQFKSSLADRKRTHLLEEVEAKVAASEADVAKMKDVAKGLAAVGGIGEPMSDTLTEALEQARSAERVAQASQVVCRKSLLTATAELKKLALSGSGSGAGSELGKLQNRVNTVQQELAKLKSGAKEAEERVHVKQSLAELTTRVQITEAEVDKLCATAASDEQPSPDAVERMEKATVSANTKITSLAKIVDVKLKSAQGVLKAELQAMRSRITKAETKLGDLIAAGKVQKEKLLASELLAQALEKVDNVRSEVQKTADAELPFLKGIETMSPSEALVAIGMCEAAASSAQKSIADTRKFIVEKLAQVKQFSEGPSESCTKQLLALQKRLDGDAGKLAESKKDTAERKRKSQMQASNEKISGVELAVQKLQSAMAKFSDGRVDEMSREEAGSAMGEVSAAVQEAQSAVTNAKMFLAQRVQEAKSFSETLRKAMVTDLGKLQQRLTHCQVELAKLSKQCTEWEQGFVARELVRDAEAGLEQLQLNAQDAAKLVAPLLQDDTTTFVKGTYVQTLAGCLRGFMQKSGESAADIFSRITNGASATAADFKKFVEGLPELCGGDEGSFTDEQAGAIFSHIVGDKGNLYVADLQPLLRDRSICVASVPLVDAAEDGKEVGQIEVGEGVDVIEQKKDKDGSTWARCALLRDASVAWVLHTSSDGSSNFQESPSVGQMQSMSAVVKAMHQSCVEMCQASDRKIIELVSYKQGPLVEVKGKLQEVRTKLGQEQSKATQLKKQVGEAISRVEATAKKELQSVLEGKWKAMGEKSVREGTDAVEAAEAGAATFLEKAKAIGTNLSVSQVDDIMKEKETIVKTLEAAKALVARSLKARESHKPAQKAALLEAHLSLQKLKHRAESAESKCGAAVQTLTESRAKMVKAASKKVRTAVREEVQRTGKGFSELFDGISKGAGEVGTSEFKSFIGTLPGHELSDELVSLVHRQIAPHGLRKIGFLKAMQEFGLCQVSNPITDSCAVAAGTVLRKLEKGEIFELLEGPTEDSESKSQRIRIRAMKDAVVGWVTLKDGEGKVLLKQRDKPFMWATRETPLQSDDKTEVVRSIHADEVLELLEGPQQEKVPPELLLHVKASSDGATGWLTLRDSSGKQAASPARGFYVCKSTIAMTNTLELKNTKAVRKVAIGEVLEVVDGSGNDAGGGDLSRLRFRAVSDGTEGWVTLVGKQGTVFAEKSTKHYTVDGDAPLHEDWASGSSVVRRLSAGEAIEALEPPKEVMQDAKSVLRARAVEDGKTGWICVAGQLRPWSLKCVCQQAVAFTDGLADPESQSGRTAEPGQKLDVIEGPAVDAPSGRRRIWCASAADGVLGWATLRGADGKPFLEPA